ncbi:mucin-5AC-like [Vanacampus margaritifer]
MTSPMMIKWLGITFVLLHAGKHLEAGGDHPECWTRWYDRDDPSQTGDFETLDDLRRENSMEICHVPIQIEAQTVSGDSVDTTGETIRLFDTTRGFACVNADQSSGHCSDYRVRFRCPLNFCPDEECWTPWFDRDNPSGKGDFETLPDLHKENPWKICKHPIKIEIKTTSGDSASSTGDVIYAADTDVGFVCRNCDQPHRGKCADYQVRFLCPLEFCKPKECKTPWFDRDNPGGTGDFELLENLQNENPNKICLFPLDIEVKTVAGNSLSSTGDAISVLDANTGFVCKNEDQRDGTCSDYQVRFTCPNEFCKEHECWTPWLDRDNPTGAGDFETIDKLRHEYPYQICPTPLQIEVETIHGFSVAATGDIIHVADVKTGFICENYNQKHGICSDYHVRFRCPLDFCKPPECWTRWFDIDNPSKGGDFERISRIRQRFPSKICDMPSAIEAHTKSGATVDSTGDVIYVADTETGFICKNSHQKGGQCSDYEVRFKCPLSFCHPDVCYTKWFNHDQPSGTGDYELLSHLKPQNLDICEDPIDIEVITVSYNYPIAYTGQIPFIYSASEGFACRNEDQKEKQCYDYKVRFGCPCK